MPPILFKDLFVEIRHSMGRFLSILLIVALGTAFFAGIKASAPDMKASADSYFDAYNLQDIQVFSTLGLTDEDLKEISEIPGVETVQGLFTMDVLTDLGSSQLVYKLFSLPEDQAVNTLRLVEGRLPEAADECVVEAADVGNELYGGYTVGDTIKIYSGTDEPLTDTLEYTTYKVVGTAYTPRYISYEKGTSSIGSGSVSGFLFVPESDIKADYWTEADVLVSGAQSLNSYTDAYFDLVDPVVKAIEAIGDDRLEARIASQQETLDEEKAKADEKLTDAKAQLDDAANEIASGKTEIAENEQKLADAKAQLESGWTQYNEGVQTLEDKEAQVNDGLAQLKVAKETLQTLQGQKEQVDAGIMQAQAGLDSAKDAIAQIDAGLSQVQAGKEQAQAGINQAQAGISQINQGLEAVNQALSNPDLDEASKAALTAQKAELESQLETAQAGLESAEETISQLESQEADLNAKKAQAQAGQTQAQQTLDSLRESQSQLEAGIAQIQEALGKQSELDEAQAQIQAAKETLASSKQTLEDSQAQYDEGLASLDEAKAQLAQGEAEYADGLAEYNSQKAEADEELADAQKTIDDLDGEWIVLDRNSFYAYRDYEACAERMDGIASVFPVFFFLVAALVCMTTMTRMVDEQRSSIGTLKALGYSKFQIAGKYLLYAFFASVLGSILGCALGMLIFPYIIFYAWNTMYNIETIVYQFQPGLMFLAGASMTGVTLLATLFSIYKELLEVPSQLMRPKAGKAGKKILLERVPAVWNKVSFLHKVTIRNIFRYKKRFLMTVVGIAGCSALLVAGFGINDSISDIVPSQYGDIYHYNAAATAEKDDLTDELKDTKGITGVFLEQTLPVTLDIEGKDISGTVHIIDKGTEKDLQNFITLASIDGGETLAVPSDGVLISQKMAEKMDLSVGSTLTFEDADGKEISTTVQGIFKQYVGHQIFVDESVFDTWGTNASVSQTYLLQTDDQSEDAEAKLGARLIDTEVIKSITFYSKLAENFSNMIGSIKMVVVVLVMSAAMLAFVVLYNLSNVNISERMREIATIKVLGFTEKEVNAYVNRESIILAAVGSLVGLAAGIYLHHLIMNLAELDDIMFGRTIFPQSFLLSFVLTMVFAFCVNFIMKFKLRRIEMVESLKAVE